MLTDSKELINFLKSVFIVLFCVRAAKLEKFELDELCCWGRSLFPSAAFAGKVADHFCRGKRWRLG